MISFRRLLAMIASCVLIAGLIVSVASAQAAPYKVAKSTPLARLIITAKVYHYPSHATKAKAFRTVPSFTPLTGVQTVLPILQTRILKNGQTWLQVLLPGRPNSQTGWISENGVHLGATRYRIIVDRAKREAFVFDNGKEIRHFPVVVGKPSTPTPSGRFYVEEKVYVGLGQAGPWVLATSARSDVLQDFEGGPGQIGLHGLNQLGGIPGTAVSHGCVRFADQNITWIAHRVGAGTPINIY